MPSIESLVSYFDEKVSKGPEYLSDKYHQSNDDGKSWILVGFKKVV